MSDCEELVEFFSHREDGVGFMGFILLNRSSHFLSSFL